MAPIFTQEKNTLTKQFAQVSMKAALRQNMADITTPRFSPVKRTLLKLKYA
ncbi:MAG: hypothetical protein OXT65_02030 [Alphaproteobacteria bacterium]|nr:hypothetical protein [Alphaproteobacteria bacterium]